MRLEPTLPRRVTRPLVVGALLLVGCGGPSADKGQSSEPQPDDAFVDRFCTEYLAAECQAIADCRPYDDGAIGAAFVTTAECVANRVDCVDRIRPLSVSMAAGRLSYDATSARSCFESLGLPACRLGHVSCLDAGFVGRVVPRGQCYEDIECAGGACIGDGCGAPGICVAYGSVGETVRDAGLCDPNVAYFDGFPGSSGTCRARVADGGDCSQGLPCVEGSYCSGSLDSATCMSGVAGQACVPNDGNCAEGLGCQDGGTCGPRREAGGICLFSAEECAAGLTCRGADPSAGAPGFCGPFGIGGDACRQNQECGLGLYCDAASGACTDRPGLGGICDNGGRSYCFGDGLVCVTTSGQSGTCGTYAALGEPCSPSCPSGSACSVGGEEPYQPCATGLQCAGGVCNSVPASACTPS